MTYLIRWSTSRKTTKNKINTNVVAGCGLALLQEEMNNGDVVAQETASVRDGLVHLCCIANTCPSKQQHGGSRDRQYS